MREKFFTYSERVGVYTRGKNAFLEGSPRDSNPYAESKDLEGLWWHGWDKAKGKRKGERSPIDERAF